MKLARVDLPDQLGSAVRDTCRHDECGAVFGTTGYVYGNGRLGTGGSNGNCGEGDGSGIGERCQHGGGKHIYLRRVASSRVGYEIACYRVRAQYADRQLCPHNGDEEKRDQEGPEHWTPH